MDEENKNKICTLKQTSYPCQNWANVTIKCIKIIIFKSDNIKKKNTDT